jgi:hypothetical protein
VLSSSSINCIVRCFGAPVIEPQGNSARNMPANDVPGRNVASTVEVICQTDAYGSTENSAGTLTEPVCATRDRSLRNR